MALINPFRKLLTGPGISQGPTPMPQIVRPGGIQAIRGIDSSQWFSPLQPIPSTAPNDLLPRQYQYTPGQNIIFTPRGEEPIDFAQLRGLAESYDLLRAVIETWKDLVVTQKLVIRSIPKPGETKAQQSKREAQDDTIALLQDFFECPDGEHDWATWLRALLEDMGVIDAACTWVERTGQRKSGSGGKVVAFRPIDGATITRYIDEQGFTPRPPNQAYAQVLYGQPAVPLTAGGFPVDQSEYEKVKKLAKYDSVTDTHELALTSGDLLYLMHNWRTWKLYGYSPVEQAIVTINIALRREIFTLDYYTAGNTPEAFYTMPPGVTIDQVREFQDYFDSVLAGNLARKRRVFFMPGDEKGAQKYVPTKEPLLKNEMDDYLASFFCFLFGISRQALIKQMNRASAEQSADSANEEGLAPTLLWVKNCVTRMIRVMGYTGYIADFEPAREPDVLKQSQADALDVGKIVTINEKREQRGLDPSTQPEANQLGEFSPQNGFIALGSTPPSQSDSADPASGRTDDKTQVDDPAPAKPKKKETTKLTKGWVTINGSHVFIGEDGTITKGPKHLMGLTPKAATARSSYSGGDKHQQDIAEKMENHLADGLGMKKSPDNKPFDLFGSKYAVEVKTMISNTNDKITMNAAAVARKDAFIKESGLKPFTVVVDARGANPKYFVRSGYGSFRVGSMTEAASPRAIRSIMRRPQ